MFFSVKHIDIKLNQDYADFLIEDEKKVLVLCDGIGEFKDSGKVAKIVVDKFISSGYSSITEVISDKEIIEHKETIQGGTTFISAINKMNSKKVHLEYLGNGGIIHFYGDFANNTNSEEPYRYGEIMIPHISPNGALTRHISNDSKKNELTSTKIDLTLNYFNGDIVLLFSDGISSLEDKIILQDGEGRYWRYENPATQLILKELDKFLQGKNNIDNFQDDLNQFNKDILEKLKKDNYLEDDASLGIIITKETLNYYKNIAK